MKSSNMKKSNVLLFLNDEGLYASGGQGKNQLSRAGYLGFGYYNEGAIHRIRSRRNPGNTNQTIFDRTFGFESIKDGLSNTMFVGEKRFRLTQVGNANYNRDDTGFAGGSGQHHQTKRRADRPPLPDVAAHSRKELWFIPSRRIQHSVGRLIGAFHYLHG